MSGLSWRAFYLTDYSGLEEAAAVWDSYISEASDFEARLVDGIPVLKEGAADQARDDFDGETADLVRGQARHIAERFLDDLDAYASRIKVLLQEAKAGFEAKRDELADLFAEKSVYLTAEGGPGEERFEVNESDLYNYLTGSGTVEPMNESEADAYERRVREQAVELSDRFKALMDSVRELDDQYAADFKALNDDPPPLPPYVGADFEAKTAEYLQEQHQDFLDRIESGEATPEEVNGWWNSLPEGDQELFVHERPELVGPVDGIPTDDRNTANRLLLDQEIAGFSPTLDDDITALEAQLEAMEENGERYIQGGYRSPLIETNEYQALVSELEELRGQQALVELRDRIEGQTNTGQDYYLLDYDSSEDGKAIVAIGNPDTADNTAVYVPGTGADLAGFSGDIDRAEIMSNDASELGVEDQETAVIAWLDYDAPDEVVPNAMDMSYAEDAGSVLSQFTHGLEATHTDDGAHTTVVGHSYGTTVVGHTASEYGVEADKIIAVASPGLDSGGAEDLGIGAENVYATTAENDAIRTSTDTLSTVLNSLPVPTGGWEDGQSDGYSAWHGTVNPVHKDYGATVFTSDATDKDGNPTDEGAAIHSGYWGDGNIAKDNIAYIVTDQTDRVVLAEGYES